MYSGMPDGNRRIFVFSLKSDLTIPDSYKENTMLKDLIILFKRDLDKLNQEIDSFGEETLIWKTTGHVTNSAGNLCLHLCGNLNHYIGARLGNNGYIRNRPAEFSLKNVSKEQLLNLVKQTRETVENTLQQLDEDDLHKEYPEQVFGQTMTNGYFLMHLAMHLAYHLGQLNYLRRVLE